MTSVPRSPGIVNCSNCGAALSAENFKRPGQGKCTRCQTEQEIVVFPAIYRRLQSSRAEAISGEEANCFNHPRKKAVIVCEDCGRFLCSLCDIQIGNHHSCPVCIDLGRKQGSASALVTTRAIHDSIALSLAILPVIMWPITLLTAPATVFYAIRHWRSPTSILPRSKIRYVAAILIASLQILGWGGMLIAVLT